MNPNERGLTFPPVSLFGFVINRPRNTKKLLVLFSNSNKQQKYFEQFSVKIFETIHSTWAHEVMKYKLRRFAHVYSAVEEDFESTSFLFGNLRDLLSAHAGKQKD